MIRTLALAAAAALTFSAAAVAQTSVPTTEEPILTDVYLGSEDATIVIEEYASLTCVHCAAFANDVFPQLQEKYIDTGKVRFVVKPFPLDPVSAGAFLLTRCDADDQYYPRVEHLFETQETWIASENPGEALFVAMSEEFDMSREEFEACLTNRSALNWVMASRDAGADMVTGTPTFVINGVATKGNMSIDAFSAIIDPMLEAPAAE